MAKEAKSQEQSFPEFTEENFEFLEAYAFDQVSKTKRANNAHTMSLILLFVGFIFLIFLTFFDLSKSSSIECGAEHVTNCVIEHMEAASTLKWIETIMSTLFGALGSYIFATWRDEKSE